MASMCIYREPDSRVLIVESVMKKNQDQMSLYYQTTLFFEFRAIKGGLVGFTWHYMLLIGKENAR